MRTRKYMEALVGGQGNVLTHHKTIKDLEKYYASVGDNKDVQQFLKNVTSDKEGCVNYQLTCQLLASALALDCNENENRYGIHSFPFEKLV